MSDRLIEVEQDVEARLNQIADNFKRGAKITLIVRTPGNDDADFIMTTDQPRDIRAALDRRLGRDQSGSNSSMSESTKIEWSNTLLDGKCVKRAEAEAAAAALGEGWRLPTVDELQTILDRSRHSPAADTDRFPDTQSEPYWTSTPCAWDSDARWVVLFHYGYVLDYDGSLRACVRACREVPEVAA